MFTLGSIVLAVFWGLIIGVVLLVVRGSIVGSILGALLGMLVGVLLGPIINEILAVVTNVANDLLAALSATTVPAPAISDDVYIILGAVLGALGRRWEWYSWR